MALFQYRAADYSGKVVEGVMDADAEHGVVARLHDMGFVPLRISASSEAAGRTSANAVSLFLHRKVSEKALLHFTQELSTLLGAGLPLDRSLSVLANLVEGPEFKKIVGRLLEEVRAGKSLAAAMAEHSDVFPKLYVNMIRAGETGGVLDGVLRNLSEYLERSISLKEDIKAALTYPMVLVAVAGLSLVFLFVYVIPKFALIFKDVKRTIPLMARLLIGFSEALTQYGWVALILIVVGAAGMSFYIRSPEGRLQWDRWRLNAWLIGNLMRQVEVARFARTLGALLKGGVPLLEAIGTVHGVVGNRLIARAIAQVQVRVREGKGMVGPLTESGLFPPLALHMIAVGQETGRLEGMLVNVADHFDQEVKRATKRLTSMLEPIMIVGLGLTIGTVVVSMLTAIFSINDLPF
ncbi:MAG TPA: type II secretion system F family protein [Candidatus Binatia bacterium]